MYYHTVYTESPETERLAALAAQAAAKLAELPYVPRVHFFKEDPAGKYARPFRVSGFCDYRTHAENFDIFIREPLSPTKMVQTVLHEAAHISQHHTGELRKLTTQESEYRAKQFAYLAPIGSTYESVFSELARQLCKLSLQAGNLPKAESYRLLLKEFDPEAAAALRDDCMTPAEKTLRRKLEVEKLQREVASEVRVKEAVQRFKHWQKEQEKQKWW